MTDSHYPVLEGDGGTCVSCLHSKPGTSLLTSTPIGIGGTQLSQEPVPSGSGREAHYTVFAGYQHEKDLAPNFSPCPGQNGLRWLRLTGRLLGTWPSFPTVPAQLGGKHQWPQRLLGPHLD